jgi:hypothetical protein
MSPLGGCTAALIFNQALLQLNARHSALPKPLSLVCCASNLAILIVVRSALAEQAASLRWLAFLNFFLSLTWLHVLRFRISALFQRE